MIPKSQINIKHTDGGELEFVDTRSPYTGYYIETNNGELYAGIDNIELGFPLQPIGEIMAKNANPTINIKKFNLFKDDIKDFLQKTIPVPTVKRYPSQEDYERGYYMRYFSKRINNSLYYEIDKNVYNSINRKESIYDHNLYEIGLLRWHITGEVHRLNTEELSKVEVKFPNISYLFPLLDEFLRPDTTALRENLTTEGGLLYTADGEEYIGLYHIHPTEGPMVGASHTDIPHSKLYYTNQLPSPGGISYEEWLQNQQTNSDIYTLASEIPLRDTGYIPPGISRIPESYNCQALWGPPAPNY